MAGTSGDWMQAGAPRGPSTGPGPAPPPPPPPPPYQPFGYPPPDYPPPPYARTYPGYGPPPRSGTNGLSIASLVLGILWFYGVGSLLALIFGLVARKQIRESGDRQSGGGMATAGIVLGVVGVIGAILLTVVLATAVHHIQSSFNAESSCSATYRTVEVAVEAYDAQVGRNPTSVDDLLHTVSVNGTTFGPWLKGRPYDAGHYQIELSPDGSGTIGVFTTGANPTQIGNTNSSADCFDVGF